MMLYRFPVRDVLLASAESFLNLVSWRIVDLERKHRGTHARKKADLAAESRPIPPDPSTRKELQPALAIYAHGRIRPRILSHLHTRLALSY